MQNSFSIPGLICKIAISPKAINTLVKLGFWLPSFWPHFDRLVFFVAISIFQYFDFVFLFCSAPLCFWIFFFFCIIISIIGRIITLIVCRERGSRVSLRELCLRQWRDVDSLFTSSHMRWQRERRLACSLWLAREAHTLVASSIALVGACLRFADEEKAHGLFLKKRAWGARQGSCAPVPGRVGSVTGVHAKRCSRSGRFQVINGQINC